ncbi:Ubiquitin receptor RAD23b like [Actinidia chinensis var. chinensis]|uniref:Ubiquitin receptor RAD23 n=1 Tax=Actinidia chinensis var. chinensis TaxID=1590841 RepID=A0A2R6QG18_ACTCC|nr:Ubiquitin receptor RAD23b like [Actinidia chinensis var. chinensis]
MKLTVKTLKGSHFEIRVQPTDTIMSIKKNIEDEQGKDNYPCGQQLLVHNGKVLEDESTLVENKVSEDEFLVVMLSKSKTLGSSGTSSTQPVTQPTSNPTPAPEPPVQAPAPGSTSSASNVATANTPSDTYGHAASNLVAGSNLEQTIQQIMDMGGGTWDKETVTRALQAAYNNPERAVDYLYSGIPEAAEIAVPGAHFPANQAATEGDAIFGETISGGGGLGPFDFLRNSQQPMLQELGRQNPQLLRPDHAEFLQLINEPFDGSEGDFFDQPEQEMPHAISVTPAEQEAVDRLEAMGFDGALVIEAFLACDRNEELTVNYLLENAGGFED